MDSREQEWGPRKGTWMRGIGSSISQRIAALDEEELSGVLEPMRTTLSAAGVARDAWCVVRDGSKHWTVSRVWLIVPSRLRETMITSQSRRVIKSRTV